MIAERDALIEELSRRYEQMREDFKYNLGLIEQRDAELSRTKKLLEQAKLEIEDKEYERRALNSTVEELQKQEAVFKEALLTERAQYKVILR